jgi:hypothetical protein
MDRAFSTHGGEEKYTEDFGGKAGKKEPTRKTQT